MTIPLSGGIAGASSLIPMSISGSSSDNNLGESTRSKISSNCKKVKSREDSEADESVGELAVCLEKGKTIPKEVSFKWFKSYKDQNPVEVRWLTLTSLGILKVQLQEDDIGEEEIFIPDESVFQEESEITFVKPAGVGEHKFKSSECRVEMTYMDWTVRCLSGS